MYPGASLIMAAVEKVSAKALVGRHSIFMLDIVGDMKKQGFLPFVEKLWQTHGDIFDVKLGGTQMIFPIHPDMARHVLVSQSQNYQKTKSYDRTRRYLFGNGLVSSIGDLWQRQRRLMAPFFTPRGIEQYAAIMVEEAKAVIQRWEGMQGQEVDMRAEMVRVTSTIILRTMFSMAGDDAAVKMHDAVQTMLNFSGVGQGNMRFPIWVPTPENRNYIKARDMVRGYIDGIIVKRRQSPEDAWPDDLLSKLLLTTDEESGTMMSDEQARDETITFFVAGYETTAHTLSTTLWLLSQNPEIAAALHAELDSVIGQREATLDDLRQLPYTLSIIKETLRLYPPTPVLPRDVQANDEIAAYRIPAGAIMMVSNWFTHRHPDFWPQPEVFDPMRWTPEAEKARHPYAYYPFMAGPRICIGNNFSLMETHILLAFIARNFAPVHRQNHPLNWDVQGTIVPIGGLPMTIRKR
jgi:cytochrome P450